MRKIVRYFFIIAIVLYHSLANAQQGFYVPGAGTIYFTAGDTATIFSNVINFGNFGVGKNAFVNFSGLTWQNDPNSLITDESLGGYGVSGIGGWVRFLSDTSKQILIGGYNAATKTGPSFPRLQIQNSFGIQLSQSNAKVRNQFDFAKGLVYLQDYIMSVGNNNPGIISGYDSSRYFVTSNQPGQGLLLRENIISSDGQIVFPVGTDSNAYTPAALQNNTMNGDDYYVNVFDTVRSNLFTGTNLQTQGVNKTWAIGKRLKNSPDNSQIFLQHLNKDEGSFFTANKNYAYVSYFNGTSWDTGAPQSFPSPGYLTTGIPLSNSGVNSRTFINNVAAPSYFTKLTGVGANDSLQTILWFNARRTGDSTVLVYWNTNPEVNVQYFIVQRRLSNDTSFTNVDTVYSLVGGAISLTQLDYSMIDPNNYTGISFYRLQVMNVNSTFFYSNIIAVGGVLGNSLNLIWPNPTPNNFFVSMDPVWKIKWIVIWNAIGQKVKEVNVSGQTIVQMGGLIPGTYFVSYISETKYIVETKKLVVVGY